MGNDGYKAGKKTRALPPPVKLEIDGFDEGEELLDDPAYTWVTDATLYFKASSIGSDGSITITFVIPDEDKVAALYISNWAAKQILGRFYAREK